MVRTVLRTIHSVNKQIMVCTVWRTINSGNKHIMIRILLHTCTMIHSGNKQLWYVRHYVQQTKYGMYGTIYVQYITVTNPVSLHDLISFGKSLSVDVSMSVHCRRLRKLSSAQYVLWSGGQNTEVPGPEEVSTIYLPETSDCYWF